MSQQSNTSDGTIFTMMPSSSQFDPLSGLHGHHLEQDLELQVSCLSDDELIELLKNTEDPAELAYLNMELSRQTLPDGRGEFYIETFADALLS
jgi:hypothetical protein